MNRQETVVLVHGLWMHGAVMMLLRRRMENSGCQAQSYTYPPMRLSLGENGARLADYCRRLNAQRLHFFGHSMGGLVIMKMLENVANLKIGRIVLAGPPFTGSYAAQRLARLPGGRTALGRSLPEWLNSAPPDNLERYEIGVIAGSLSFGMGTLIAPGLARPNDGVVSVAETRVPAARDHIVLKVSHTAMLISPAVARQACAFLQHGMFARDN